jgi:hypothetical protein
MAGEDVEEVPAWLGDARNPAWLVSEAGRVWLDTPSGMAWLISEEGRAWVEGDEGMAWFCSREAEWWSRNRPSWATREEVLRRVDMARALVASPATALRDKLCNLSGSYAVEVGWLPELRSLLGRDAVRVYGRVALIVLDPQKSGTAAQVTAAIRTDDWLNDWISARIEPLVLPRREPDLIEAWFGVEQLGVDLSGAG